MKPSGTSHQRDSSIEDPTRAEFFFICVLIDVTTGHISSLKLIVLLSIPNIWATITWRLDASLHNMLT